MDERVSIPKSWPVIMLIKDKNVLWIENNCTKVSMGKEKVSNTVVHKEIKHVAAFP